MIQSTLKSLLINDLELLFFLIVAKINYKNKNLYQKTRKCLNYEHSLALLFNRTFRLKRN